MSRLLVSLLALLILNGSIETCNLAPQKWNGEDYLEDLSYNDIESFYEFFTECVLELEDFVPEQDDNDEERTVKVMKEWIVTSIWEFPVFFTCLTHTFFHYRSIMPEDVDQELFAPPDAVHFS